MSNVWDYRMDNWYEVRVDYEKVAAFGPIRQEALEQAHDLIEKTRYDLYKDRVLQIVLINKVQSRDEHGRPSFLRDRIREEVVHEEHPTVLEVEPPSGWPRVDSSYDISVM